MSRARDLFAGAGGWDIAAAGLGWEVDGVENNDAARLTREAAGLLTTGSDVRDVVPARGAYLVDIASPPCQSFSLAGTGTGRRALDVVLAGIDLYAVGSPPTHEDLTYATGDERTALVLEPLRIALAGRSPFLAWEQVPAVLPVWHACARVLRSHGYSVAVGILNAEQYGVPQTRRRAVLVARSDGGVATLPTPTHSRYHVRTPERMDAGVLPWVSMAAALGWPPGITGFPRLADSADVIDIDGVSYRARDLRSTSRPAQAVTEKARSWSRWELESRRDSPHWIAENGPRENRTADAPAVTVTGEAHRWTWALRNGNQSKATRRGADEPAPTMAFGNTPETCVWEPASLRQGTGTNATVREVDAPAGTVHFGARLNTVSWQDKGFERQRISVEEAAALQTFPVGFPFRGPATRQFQQIGNAIPPVLAAAILTHLGVPA